MIRFLECPDIHANKKWLDITLQCLDKIGEAAIKEKVDFITFPGDLHDSRFYVGDGSGYNTFRKKIKDLLKICPIVAVEGTESHDGKGSYGPLEDLGLVLLKPGKVYGYYDKAFENDDPFIASVDLYSMEDPDCILFGVPELNKSNIQAKLSLSAEKANAEVVKQFDKYIQEFVGPMRLKYKDVPAIGLLHGVVSERRQENSDNLVVRVSDIVITTDILRQANLDRWTLGHLHHPREFDSICGGYAGYPGIDHNPWGKCDFVPAFNMIEIGKPIIRIPYGTPMRKKITPGMAIANDPNIAYWIESDDPDRLLPEGLHPWSRITYTEETTETRRVTKEQADEAKTLWDMFKLIDPDVRPELKDKIDSIPIPDKNITGNKLDAKLSYVKIKGCDLFGGKTVEFDLNNLATGMNQLIGTNGNGDGKSSLLGMCSLYPCVVGKDTKSGRQSALKDFFSGQDSSIEKSGIVNGHDHHHLITIKGSSTKNPKTECYLDIDGIPQLEKATFDTMMQKCEELYGNYEDYLLTTFYEQPQQSKNQRSGLMTATMTEARNLVQNIAGIDREQEKRFALDQVALGEKQEQQLESDINALEIYSEDTGQLKIDFANKGAGIVLQDNYLNRIKDKGIEVKAKEDSYQLKNTENEKLIDRKTHVKKSIELSIYAIHLSETRIIDLQDAVSNLKANQDTISKDDEAKKLEQNYSNLLIEYNRIMTEYEKSVISQGTTKREQQTIIDNAEKTKLSHNREIELISEPCENCGYIKPDVQENIDKLNNSISLLDESIKMSGDNIATMIPIVKPEIVEPIEPPKSLTEFEREEIQEAVNEGLKAETAIGELTAGIKKDQVLLDSYNKDMDSIIVDNNINHHLAITTKYLNSVRNLYSKVSKNISTLEAEKKAINERLIKAEAGAEELATKKGKLLTSEVNRKDWTYIAKMLNPDKIPALELDIILDSIDAEATRNIQPFLEGRYAFHTETQKQGDKKSVDKFDVLIHDNETGKSFSMFYTNPGNKAFYSDCYIKSLIRKRNERQMRSYSPIIYDEADGPVNPIRVKAYYDIQQAYFQNEKVLIVSQKDISASYVEKVFNIEEMKS